VLDPLEKNEHIRKYWGSEKLKSILKEAEEMVSVLIVCVGAYADAREIMLQYKEHYLEMYGNDPALLQPRRMGKSAIRKVGILIRELSDVMMTMMKMSMLSQVPLPH
jgi:hypothetical protein